MAEAGSNCYPLYRIDGPPPAAPFYGLLQAAEAVAAGVRVVPDVDEKGVERWMNGVQVYPYPPDTGSGWDANNTTAGGTEATSKGFGSEDVPDLPIFGPLTAYLAETCFSYKIWNQDEYKARAVAAFTAVESRIVADELMRGTSIPSNPHLADGHGSFPNGDAVTSIRYGISLLEDAIGETGRQGVLHVSPGVLSAFREPWAIDNKTGVVRTLNGTVVIPDGGYSGGSTPTGHTPGEWIYATGPIDVRRTEVLVLPERVDQALDRGNTKGATVGRPNKITYRVERYYLVDWDTQLQAAVRVDACTDDCTST